LDRLAKVATVILVKNNFNRGDGLTLSQALSPITSLLRNEKQDQAEQVLHSTNTPFFIATIYEPRVQTGRE
jgi:hypothetical protein